MSVPVLIVGESGTGKTFSIKTLNPKTTFIINVGNKPLSFKTSGYNEKNEEGKVGNIINTSDPAQILKIVKELPVARPEVREIIIDDFQYFMAFLYISRIGERQYYDKFNDILRYTKMIYDASSEGRKDLIVYFTCHSDDIDELTRRAKTAGKAVNKHLTLEGLFTIVLWTKVFHEPGEKPKNEYFFETQRDATNTAKSPENMFDFRIPNDLYYVSERIRSYYEL